MENIILFLYDTEVADKAAKNEEDSMIAIKYFNPIDYDSEKKFSLCGSLVTMYQGIEKLTGSAPTCMALKTLTFEFLATEGRFIIALGCDISSDRKLRQELKILIELITLRYSSISAMLERWEKLKMEDDIISILQFIKPMAKLQVSFDIQMKSLLLIENFAKQASFYGLCLFYGEKSLYSQLDADMTLRLWIARFFADDSYTTAFTDHLILQHFPVFIEQRALKRMRFFNNLKVRKEHSLKQKTRSAKFLTSQHFHNSTSTLDDDIDAKKIENFESRRLKKVILVAVQANETMIIILTEEENFDSDLYKTWEKPLLQLDEQLEAKIPLHVADVEQ